MTTMEKTIPADAACHAPVLAENRNTKAPMQKIFHDWNKDAANRRADEWWARQKGLRQIGRIEEHRGVKGRNAGEMDWWVVTIQFEAELATR